MLETPPTAGIDGLPDKREMMLQLMNSLPPEQLEAALKMLVALKKNQPLRSKIEPSLRPISTGVVLAFKQRER